MTSATITTSRLDATPDALGRILRIMRLHFVNPMTVLGTPLMIFGFILAGHLAIWGIITIAAPADGLADAQAGMMSGSGGSYFIFVYMLVVAVQATNQNFRFALSYSVTRRDYSLGTALTFVILSILFTAIMLVLGQIELATGGWGLSGRMFVPEYLDFGLAGRGALYLLAFLFFFFVGSAAASVFVRWGSRGMTYAFVILAAALIGVAALVTLAEGWPSVGRFFVEAGVLGTAAWSLVPTALFAVAGFALLRRATPRS